MQQLLEEIPTLDASTVELVLGELLSNVTRHTPGDVFVDYRITQDSLELEVGDNGSGIPTEHLLSDPKKLLGSGRGMYLIYTYADSVLVTNTSHGSTIIISFLL